MLVSPFCWAGKLTPKCDFLLTVELDEEGVNPKFAHSDRLAAELNQYAFFYPVARDGSTHYVSTNDPTALVTILAQGSYPVKSILNGKASIPALDRLNKNLGRTYIYGRKMMLDLAKIHAYVLDGYYIVSRKDKDDKSLFATLIVESSGPLSINMNLWPGYHLVPQSESRYQEVILGSFDTESADSMSVKVSKNRITLRYSLPYGYGEDALGFELSDSGALVALVDRNGNRYEIFSYYPFQD